MKPKRKVNAAGVGGAIATVAVFILTQVGVDVDAITAAAFATIASFGLAFLVPSAEGE